MCKKTKMVLFMVLVGIISCSLVLSGCGGAKDKQAADAGGKIVIKAAHVAGTDYPYQIGLEAFAKSVAAKTNGKVEVQIYPNGQLGGDERAVVEALQLGNITMTIVNSSVAANFTPKADVFNLPFIFKDQQHLYKASDGEPGKIVAKDLEGKGLKVLSWWNGQQRHMFNSKKPINTLEDMKGMKLRVMQSPVSIATLNALGAMATPMAAGEVYSAIQQGVIDGAENNYLSIRTYKFFEVAKYISLTGHFSEACPLLIDLKFFNKQTPEIQKALLEAAADGQQAMRKYIQEQDTSVENELKAKGVIVNKVEDIESFRKAVIPVYAQFESKIGKDLIDMVRNMQ